MAPLCCCLRRSARKPRGLWKGTAEPAVGGLNLKWNSGIREGSSAIRIEGAVWNSGAGERDLRSVRTCFDPGTIGGPHANHLKEGRCMIFAFCSPTR